MGARRAIAIVLWTVGALILTVCALFIWLLRDGLGPDATDSPGLAALARFAAGMAGMAVFYLTPLLLGCLVHPWRRRSA